LWAAVKCPDCGTEDPDGFTYCTGCRRRRTWAPGVKALEDLKPPSVGVVEDRNTPSSARLVCLEGEIKGQEFVLTAREMSLGRQSPCDFVVNNPQVSRKHARIRLSSSGYQIEDAGSTHGTWVNEVRLTGPHLLTDQDVIRIGPVKFGFRSGARTPDVPPGLMTIMEDVGPDPPAFETPRPRRAPVPAAIPPDPVPSLQSVREELADFEHSLGPFLQRLQALGVAVSGLTSELAEERRVAVKPAVLPDSVRQLAADLEAVGGPERYRAVQRLLDELRSAPTDVKLLFRLSEELPAIIALVEAYLRAVDVLREVKPR